MPSDQPREGFIPPRLGYGSKAALLGGLFARDGRSMLNLLTERAYSVRMGVGRIASKALFLVNAPETVREVMVDRVAAFPKHHYLAEILQPLIGISLFNANGGGGRPPLAPPRAIAASPGTPKRRCAMSPPTSSSAPSCRRHWMRRRPTRSTRRSAATRRTPSGSWA